MTRITIALAVITTTFVMVGTNKHLRMKSLIQEYQVARGNLLKEQAIARGKGIMNTHLLPYVLERYRDERDIQFTVAMIGRCQTKEDNDILWATARDPRSRQQIRIICMANLLSRGYVEVWGEITEVDMEVIAVSMPVHIVHWRQLMLQYSGRSSNFLRRDTYPERHRFKALFRECIEKYRADQTRQMVENT